MKKDINVEYLLKENKKFGIVWEEGCGRDKPRTNRKRKYSIKNWKETELLELIRFVISNTERDSITRELFARQLKAKLSLVHNCFAKLELEGLLCKSNYIMHDEATSELGGIILKNGYKTKDWPRTKSWWNAKIYKIRK